MKTFFILCLMYSSLLQAQIIKPDHDIAMAINFERKPDPSKQNLLALQGYGFANDKPPSKHPFIDSIKANRKYPAWAPVLSIIESSVVLWGLDRYIFVEPTAKIGINTWKNNLKYEWQWGRNKFGESFFLNMVTGASYFNCPRPMGYDFYQSIPYTVGGSLLWVYFGQSYRPTYNDIIFMPVNGVFFGEIQYRLSSDILDERSRGFERVMRETGAFIIDPGRGVTRFWQGKMFNVTRSDYYEKEPMNFAVEAGTDRINDGIKLGTGQIREMLRVSFDYGNPFEVKDREIMDYFKTNFQFRDKSGNNWLVNASEYGLLYGKNSQAGKKDVLTGFFQYYDFIDNSLYDLSAMALGGGVLMRSALGKKAIFRMNFHVGGIPFGGVSKTFGFDTARFREYNVGGGLESKIECKVKVGKWLTPELNGSYYWIHTYRGTPGNYLTGIINPRLSLSFIKNTALGVEYLIYYNNKLKTGTPNVNFQNSEGMAFVSYRINCCETK